MLEVYCMHDLEKKLDAIMIRLSNQSLCIGLKDFVSSFEVGKFYSVTTNPPDRMDAYFITAFDENSSVFGCKKPDEILTWLRSSDELCSAKGSERGDIPILVIRNNLSVEASVRTEIIHVDPNLIRFIRSRDLLFYYRNRVNMLFEFRNRSKINKFPPFDAENERFGMEIVDKFKDRLSRDDITKTELNAKIDECNDSILSLDKNKDQLKTDTGFKIYDFIQNNPNGNLENVQSIYTQIESSIGDIDRQISSIRAKITEYQKELAAIPAGSYQALCSAVESSIRKHESNNKLIAELEAFEREMESDLYFNPK